MKIDNSEKVEPSSVRQFFLKLKMRNIFRYFEKLPNREKNHFSYPFLGVKISLENTFPFHWRNKQQGLVRDKRVLVRKPLVSKNRFKIRTGTIITKLCKIFLTFKYLADQATLLADFFRLCDKSVFDQSRYKREPYLL